MRDRYVADPQANWTIHDLAKWATASPRGKGATLPRSMTLNLPSMRLIPVAVVLALGIFVLLIWLDAPDWTLPIVMLAWIAVFDLVISPIAGKRALKRLKKAMDDGEIILVGYATYYQWTRQLTYAGVRRPHYKEAVHWLNTEYFSLLAQLDPEAAFAQLEEPARAFRAHLEKTKKPKHLHLF